MSRFLLPRLSHLGPRFLFAILTATLGSPRDARPAPAPADTSWWDGAFTSGMNGPVRSLAVFDNEIIAGGDFTAAGRSLTGYIARWDGEAWQPLGEEEGRPYGPVTAMLSRGSRLFAGSSPPAFGFFTLISYWNGTAWTPSYNTGGSGSISSFIDYDHAIIAGGAFFSWPQGHQSGNAVRLPEGASTWEGFSGGFTPPFTTSVRALAEFRPVSSPGRNERLLDHLNGELIGGGLIGHETGFARVARRLGSAWQPLGPDPDLEVRTLARLDDRLVAGGRPTGSGPAVFSWTGATWDPVGDPFVDETSGSGRPGEVNVALSHAGGLIVGGRFTRSGAAALHNVALWNGGWLSLGEGIEDPVNALAIAPDGSPVAASGEFPVRAGDVSRWNGSAWTRLAGPEGAGLDKGVEAMDRGVEAMTVHQGLLVAGGSFLHGGGRSLSRVGVFDGASWTPLGDGFDGTVRALLSFEGSLIAAGDFQKSGSEPARRIALWDGSAWSTIAGGMNGTVSALADAGILVAAGSFTEAGGLQLSNIVQWAWGIGEWVPIGGPAEPAGSAINALTVFDGNLVAGGSFSRLGGVDALNVAAWTAGAWSPLGPGLNGTVRDLIEHQGCLYAAGALQDGSGNFAPLARWDGSGWTFLGLSDSPYGFGAEGRSLAVYDDELIVGGIIASLQGQAVGNPAVWDGLGWSPLGSGTANYYGLSRVSALQPLGGYLFVGGDFTIAGGKPSQFFARWHKPGVPVPVSVVSLSAERVAAGVRVRWVVHDEPSNHAGFQILREVDGERSPASPALPGGRADYEFLDRDASPGALRYWLAETTRGGETAWHGPVDVPAAAETPGLRPRLAQNRPNPFRRSTRIDFDTKVAGPVTLRVFDAAGREVARLHDGILPAGHHEVTWEMTEDSSDRVRPGLYFYRLETPYGAVTRKIVRVN